MTTVIALRRRLAMSGDSGITLIEMVVAMIVMSTLMAIFMTGMLELYKISSGTEAKSTAQSQVSLGLLRISKELPYAAEIGDPYLSGGDQYVEALIIRTTTAQCLRLRVSNSQLQQRTWTYQSPAVSPPSNLTAWTVLASYVVSAQPFQYVPADDTVGYQRLKVALATVSGSGPSQTVRQSAVTFTALNTSRDARVGVCTEGRNLP